MKFAAGIIFMAFVSFGQSVILNYEFRMANWNRAGIFYCCENKAQNTGNSTIIEEVRGEHSSGKTNEDVETFMENGHTLTSFPSNLASFFPKLKVIFITGPLLQLSSSDLKPFPDLILFYSWDGKFTSIDGDLFQYTRKLKFIIFSVPGLKKVSENLLTGLDDLVSLNFYFSGCIGTFDAKKPQLIEQFKQKLLLQCPPLEPSTSPPTTPQSTTHPSTKNSTQSSIRCSLNFGILIIIMCQLFY
jgi:hypothetical protein